MKWGLKGGGPNPHSHMSHHSALNSLFFFTEGTFICDVPEGFEALTSLHSGLSSFSLSRFLRTVCVLRVKYPNHKSEIVNDININDSEMFKDKYSLLYRTHPVIIGFMTLLICHYLCEMGYFL